MSKKVLNISLFVIVLVAIFASAYIWYSFGMKPKTEDAPSLASSVQNQIRLEGALVNEKNADLGFVLSGNITAINKKVGDNVKVGEVLAIQNSADIQAQVGAAKANVVAAQAQLDGANHDLKKEKLKIKDFSGNAKKEQRAQVASNKDGVSAQQAVVVAAQDSLNAAQAVLAKTVLKAPFDGIITRQDGEVGEIAGATAQPFLTVVSNEPLTKIEVFASDLDAGKITVGQKAQVAFDVLGEQKVLEATVTSIDPAANAQNASAYRVVLHLNQADASLKSGMHAVAIL